MLEFLLGTEERAKIKEIYRRAKADSDLNKSVFILVPEQYSMYAEQELLSELGLSAQSKIQILTFSRLANMIFSKLGPLRTNYIDKAGKYLLACLSLRRCKNELSFFSRNISQPGFPALIVSLISEFKRYGITPDSLRKTAKELEEPLLALKLSELALIFEVFNALVDENHTNAEDNLSLALLKIPQADFLQGSLYISYFRSFTPVEYEALAALMPKMDICVSLCCDNESDSQLFAPQLATLTQLSRLASDLGIPLKQPQLVSADKPFQASDLEWLRDNYFSPEPKALDKMPQNVHILRPQNHYTEAYAAARLIKRLCRTKGYKLNDFLILTGSLENYELILPSVFEEFDLNIFIDQKISLAESPLMRMVLSILEILAFGFSYERIMTLLRSGFWDISDAQCDIFENYILAADLSHRQWAQVEPWTFNPDKNLFDMEEINGIKSAVLAPILELLGMFRGRKTAGEIADKLCQWLNSRCIQPKVSRKIDSLRANGNVLGGEQLVGVWNSFVSVVNRISDCIGTIPATFSEFYEYFAASISELSVGIVPPTQDKVVVSEVSHFRSTGAKVVLVLGVSDKVFPKSHNAEGILSDNERNTLHSAGLVLAPDSFARQKEEQFLVYSVFCTPTDELYLFSPMSDKEGKGLAASEVVKRIKSSILPLLEYEEDKSPLDLIEGKPHTFFELCARLFECGFDAEQLSPVWKSVYLCFENDEPYAKKLKHFSDMYKLSGEPDSISKAMAKKLYGEPLTLSVSKLEKYNTCAYSFFMKYGLLAEERLLGGLKSTDTGTILHSVLCSYFEDKAQNHTDYEKITRQDCFDEITALVDKLASESDNTHFVSSNYYGYMLLRLKSIATTTAWKLVRFYSKSKFRPTGFEVSFGKAGDLPPYEIQSANGSVSLRGFIDRIDSAVIDNNEYIAVTDYKSSEKKLDMRMIDAGVTLQPLLYANAAAKSGKDKIPAAMLYMQMNDPILKFDLPPDELEWETAMCDGLKAHGLFLDDARVLSALDPDMESKAAPHYINIDTKSRLSREYFEKRLEDAEVCAAETADKILSGEILPSVPDIPGFDPCSYCPYANICKNE